MSISKEIKKVNRKFKSWLFKREYQKNNFSESKKLILFFVPKEVDTITGGILSICTIYKVVNELKNVHDCNVIASFLPKINGLDYKYSKFQNDMVIFNFDQITSYFKSFDFLEIHLPDYMIPLFKRENPDLITFFEWVKNNPNLKINILNQNDLLMPDLVHINDLKKITTNVTMTVAHEKYATLERRNYYNVPLHLFSPWLSPKPYLFKDYQSKENIIVLSPDDIDRVPSGTNITKEQIIEKIKFELPHYEIITIQNMTYDEYKETISRGRFTITFGEGLDGYFVESIFSGSVSFAVYNEIFFKPSFRDLPTVYDDYNVLFDKIISDIKHYDNEKHYADYNLILNEKLSKIYSYERLQKNVTDYYKGNVDFQ
jgi:hypothetical protein